MNIKELKKMIAEEYSAYTKQVKEQDLPGMDMGMDMPPMDAPKIDVGADDIKVGGDENAEDTLRDIFNMLKDFFEGDDKPAAPKTPKAPKADKGEDDKPKGDKADDKEDKEDKDDKDDVKEALQERFQKLANIIK